MITSHYYYIFRVCICFLNLVLAEHPNIVILFADNLGYADISFFGAPTAQTPNVDRIGFEGIKLNNWNSAAHLCSASRAALLTGKYPIRTGVYPGVFKPDALNGLHPNETTLAEILKERGYATSIVGKWHLGHRPEFLPTNQGFDHWLGIPYHMSGGSIDNHTCIFDDDETMWLPLFKNQTIIEQPVRVQSLAQRYARAANGFIRQSIITEQPFFLYLPFSHVHQLCAPRDWGEPGTCQWGAKTHSTFLDAVEEMDWIVGRVLHALDNYGIANNTFVLFTSDNGPWLAEKSCSGSGGPFEGRWLRENVPMDCTACPHDYVPSPTSDNPRRCILPKTAREVDGVHCGEDVGLGSVWEANLRMPAVARWPGRIPAGSESMNLLSTLDVVPTIVSFLGKKLDGLDGEDVSAVLFGGETKVGDERALFFWRDGFEEGPLDPPFGRFDVAAVKLGRYKAWFWTKSAHYNDDIEMFHDPPLLFDVLMDPAEAFPLDSLEHAHVITKIKHLAERHKNTIERGNPLTLARDPRWIPCANPGTKCRTDAFPEQSNHFSESSRYT